MKYNKEYNVYVSKEGVICSVDKAGQLHCRVFSNSRGYELIQVKVGTKWVSRCVHRIIWETFNGKIPDNMEVDHINAVKSDNRLENLQLLTPIENVRKAQCCRVQSDIEKQKRADSNRHPKKEFGNLFIEKYGFIDSKSKIYLRQFAYYKRNGRLKP